MRSSARAFFCAAHRNADGELHGHSYEVWATWEYRGEDVRQRQMLLQEYLNDHFDHRVMVDDLCSAEALAKAIGEQVGAVACRVVRPVEGLEGAWP